MNGEETDDYKTSSGVDVSGNETFRSQIVCQSHRVESTDVEQ